LKVFFQIVKKAKLILKTIYTEESAHELQRVPESLQNVQGIKTLH
jgi:hypothetical protein